VMTGRDALPGLRILLVEDEFLVAMLVEEMLHDLHCEIVGPVSTLEEAIATVRQNRLDGVLLDANLHGKNSSPVADELLGHEVPFILVTGYSGHKGDPPVLKRAPRVRKPVNFDELADRMTEVFIRRRPNANEADEPERSPISSSN
jgi:DNA-binding response OmpR family regulator